MSNTLEDVSWLSFDLTLFEECKWEKKKLTWRVTKFSSQEMPKELVKRTAPAEIVSLQYPDTAGAQCAEGSL